ncbi:hypothetical protein [Methanosphaera sp. WGK6]|uniref:hypothetical protein n=1 Tax=Methanosphaera sp. WGK6 TaxID=1561964 RepID=UPI00084BF4BC|nr:hypothetical protein [Methanosphaera sp. WGK6]
MNITKKKYDFWANMVSRICEPPLIIIPIFLIINYFMEKNNFLVVEGISFIITTVVPLLVMSFWIKYKGMDKDFTNRKERGKPLLITVLFYFIGTYLLWFIGANRLTCALMLCFGINALIIVLINTKWKISIHIIGLAGPIVALLFVNPLGWILGLLIPIVMWSRLTLRKHTLSQLIGGLLYAFCLNTCVLYYLTGTATSSLVEIVWILLAIVTPIIFLSVLGVVDKKKIHGINDKIIMIDMLIFSILFIAFSPANALMTFILCLVVSVLIGYFSSETFVWHKGLYKIMNYIH